MQRLFILLLSFVLAATSVSSAVMHSEMQGSSQMVICADIGDSGIITIRLDASGNPIADHHGCPDCLAALATALCPAAADWLVPQASALALFARATPAGHGRPSPAASARGPPVFA